MIELNVVLTYVLYKYNCRRPTAGFADLSVRMILEWMVESVMHNSQPNIAHGMLFQ